MGVFGWPNPGRGEEGRGPRGWDRGVAVARPGSRRLLTRPVAQLDSTRLSARWQEAAAKARGGSGEGEKARAEEVRERRGERRRTGGRGGGRCIAFRSRRWRKLGS